MKLDFIPNGDDGRPLVRIWGFVPDEARRLREMVMRLANGRAVSVEVHLLPGVEPIDGCRLTLKAGEEDRGVYDLIGENSFECLLTRQKWAHVADLIRPFLKEDMHRLGGYQWLDESADTDISLLLSVNGTW